MFENEVYSRNYKSGDNITINIDPKNIGQWDNLDYVTSNGAGDATITIDELDWLRAKMEEDKEYEKLAGESAAVKIALDQLNEAKHKLKVTAHLARTHDHVD